MILRVVTRINPTSATWHGLANERADPPYFLRLTRGAVLRIRSDAVLDCRMYSACRVNARPIQDALLDSKSDQVSRRDRHGQRRITCGLAVALCGPSCRSVVCSHLSGVVRGGRHSLASQGGCTKLERLEIQSGYQSYGSYDEHQTLPQLQPSKKKSARAFLSQLRQGCQ